MVPNQSSGEELAQEHEHASWPRVPSRQFSYTSNDVSKPRLTPADPKRERRRWILPAVVAVGLVLLAAFASTGYLVVANASRADRWQGRSVALAHNVDKLNAVLVERSTTLNARTEELNRVAATVRNQQNALRRSEADVSSLSSRQRALSAEKAEVEDERAQLAVQASALTNVASAFVQCNGGLSSLLSYVLDEDYYAAEAIVSDVGRDCDNAETQLSNYNSMY